MEANLIDIKDLCSSCMTRVRGRETASKLIEYVQNDKSLIINLNNVDILSFSFLDELIFWLAASANMRNVIFRVDSEIVQDKLARIVAIRDVVLFYQHDNKPAMLLESKKLQPYNTILKSSKKLNETINQ